MNWPKPIAPEVVRAARVYLDIAYPGPPPEPVAQLFAKLQTIATPELYESPLLEFEGPDPTRFALRLGNDVYPHMKLVIERSPDLHGHLYRADTHDRHFHLPETSPDRDAFCRLIQHNEQIAHRIEAAWEQQGLPTFKSYLKKDLARRAAEVQSRAGVQGPKSDVEL